MNAMNKYNLQGPASNLLLKKICLIVTFIRQFCICT